MTNLFEIAISAPGRIDQDAGVIHDVKILGKISQNQRRYSDKALDEASRQYEGLEVNLDHPEMKAAGRERKFSESIGALKNVHRHGDEVRGDLHYIKSHPWSPVLVEKAERFPNNFGLSHNAEGNTKRDRDGWVTVESVSKAHSVDVVTRPATTKGLFESADDSETVSLSEWIESHPNENTQVLECLSPDLEVPDNIDSSESLLEKLLQDSVASLDFKKIHEQLGDAGDQPMTLKQLLENTDQLPEEFELTQEDLASLSEDERQELVDYLEEEGYELSAIEGEEEEEEDGELVGALADEYEGAVETAESVLTKMDQRLQLLEVRELLQDKCDQRNLTINAATRKAILEQCETPDQIDAMLDELPMTGANYAGRKRRPVMESIHEGDYVDSYPSRGDSNPLVLK